MLRGVRKISTFGELISLGIFFGTSLRRDFVFYFIYDVTASWSHTQGNGIDQHKLFSFVPILFLVFVSCHDYDH